MVNIKTSMMDVPTVVQSELSRKVRDIATKGISKSSPLEEGLKQAFPDWKIRYASFGDQFSFQHKLEEHVITFKKGQITVESGFATQSWYLLAFFVVVVASSKLFGDFFSGSQLVMFLCFAMLLPFGLFYLIPKKWKDDISYNHQGICAIITSLENSLANERTN